MTFLVHGEITAMQALQGTMTARLGWKTMTPAHAQTVDLAQVE